MTSTTKRYYNLGNTPVAMRDSATGQLSYLLGDQLGSTTVSVNAAGGTPVVQRYLPYGAPRSTTGGSAVTDRGWIGQTRDSSTGLQYLNARYYDPVIGRFTSADPLADMSKPDSIDPYGYGRGNPTTLKDPSGLLVPVDATRTERSWDGRWTNRGYGKPGFRWDTPEKLESFKRWNRQSLFDRCWECYQEQVKSGEIPSNPSAMYQIDTEPVSRRDCDQGAYSLTCALVDRTTGMPAPRRTASPEGWEEPDPPFGEYGPWAIDSFFDVAQAGDTAGDVAEVVRDITSKGARAVGTGSSTFTGGLVDLWLIAFEVAAQGPPSGRYSQGGACTPEAQATMGFSSAC